MLCVYLRLRVCKCVCMRVCVCECVCVRLSTVISYCDDGIWYHGVIGAIGDRQYQGCAAAAVAIRVRPNKYWTRMAEQANHFVEQRWWLGRWMSRRSNL